MRRKDVGIDALYDIRAVRVLVADVKDCYAALGIVHHLWTPLPGEFDDYIAKPKANDYRSLHTAVIGPEGKPLEVQIRTWEMHHHSEYGVAAHWRYKEGVREARRDPGFDEQIAWLRQVLDWKDAVADAGEWLTEFKDSLFTDTIYVLTPQGQVVDLPRGATPVDFAYAVHTNLGHRCRGARVDGQMVPLNYRLANGQRVEVRDGQAGRPVARLAEPGAGLRRQPPRAGEGAPVVQAAAARGDRGAGSRGRRARARARRRDAHQPRRARGEGGLRQAGRAVRGRGARRGQPAPAADRHPRGGGTGARGRGRGVRRRGAHAREPRQRLRRRHPDRGRGPADDRTRALLQAGAARCDRRLRHARQGHHHPPRRVREPRAGPPRAARAADRGELGRAARRGASPSTSSSRRAIAPGCCAISRKCSRARRSTSRRSTRSRSSTSRGWASPSRCAAWPSSGARSRCWPTCRACSGRRVVSRPRRDEASSRAAGPGACRLIDRLGGSAAADWRPRALAYPQARQPSAR